MNRKLYISLFCLLAVFDSFGQNIVSGRIVDDNDRPVFPATVRMTRSSWHVINDLEGNFRAPIDDAILSDSLVISSLGYETAIYPVSDFLNANGFTVILNLRAYEISPLVISSSPSITKEFAVENLASTDIYMAPGASADPLKAVSISVYSTNTSETANPELRGSSGNYSRVILNGVPVYNPVRNQQLNGIGNFSIFNLEIIDKLDVYAGNPPLKYSNSVAGAIDIETRDNIEHNNFVLSLSLASTGALYSTNIGKRSFVQLYGNYQFSDLYKGINKSSLDYLKNFKTTDAGVNYRCNLSKNLYLNLYSYFINEGYSSTYNLYNYTGESHAEKKRNFNIFNVVWQKENYSFSLNSGTDISKSGYNFGSINEDHDEFNLYTSLDYRHLFWNRRINTQAGVSHSYSGHNYSGHLPVNYWTMDGYLTKKLGERVAHHNIELYLYSKLLVINDLTFGFGLRKNIPTVGQKNVLSGQFNSKYIISNRQSILFSAGKYHGYSMPEHNLRSINHISSVQYSLDYFMHVTNNLRLSASVYQKTENSPEFYYESRIAANTDTRFRGAELSAEYRYRNIVEITLSYTYLNSRFKTSSSSSSWQRYHNDAPALIKLASNYYNKIVNIGIDATYKTGGFYSPVIDSHVEDSIAYPVFGNYYSARLNNYLSIGLSFNRYFRIKDVGIVVFASVNNIFNRQNQRYAYYNRDFSQKYFKEFQKGLIYFGIRVSFG